MSISITDRLKTESGLRDHLRYIFHDHGFSTEPVIRTLADGRIRATCVFVVHNPVPVDSLDIAPRPEKKARLLEELDGQVARSGLKFPAPWLTAICGHRQACAAVHA